MITVKYLGVVNATPNSFSDGHLNLNLQYQNEKLSSFMRGGHGLDIGAESTAPFNMAISDREEWRRLSHYVDEHLENLKEFPVISVDTYRPQTMAKFIDNYGQYFKHIIWNDVSSIVDDETLALLKANPDLCYVLCHCLVPDRTKVCDHMEYVDDKLDVLRIKNFFCQRLAKIEEAGILVERIILDPCFGFSKTTQQNLALLESIATIASIHPNWLIGISKKSFLRHLAVQKYGEVDKAQQLILSEEFHWDYLERLTGEFAKVSGLNTLYLRVHEVGNITA